MVLHLLSIEPLAHHQNVATFSLFYRYYFGSSEMAQVVPFPYSCGRCPFYSDRLDDFSVTIPRCYNAVYVNSFSPCTARLWNSLPMECFLLTYDLNGFKSRINTPTNCRLFSTNFRLFLNRFPVWFNLFVLLFLLTPCLAVAVQSCMEWLPSHVDKVYLSREMGTGIQLNHWLKVWKL